MTFAVSLTAHRAARSIRAVNPANAVSSARIAFSPLFFVSAVLPQWVSAELSVASTVALWVLFVLIEASDVADGLVARKLGTVTDFGKILDPFADVISRLTYFGVFASGLIMPMWMFMLILYRETGITFLRAMLLRDGIALGARPGGKLKSVVYAISAGLGIVVMMTRRHEAFFAYRFTAQWIAYGAFLVAVLISWASFADYLVVTRRMYRDRSAT